MLLQVQPAPEQAGGQGGHRKHEIAGRDMDRGINRRSQQPASFSTESPDESSLHKAAPENLLAGTGDEEQDESFDSTLKEHLERYSNDVVERVHIEDGNIIGFTSSRMDTFEL